MNLLFFDTETTNLPDWRSPSDAPHQPHLIQIAAILCDDSGDVKDEWQTLVQPGAGAVMGEQAFAAHGISLDRAAADGLSIPDTWARFNELVSGAEGVVGHNVTFDLRIMRIFGARATGKKWQSPIPHRCTMRMADKIMQLPPTEKMIAAGFTKSKPPNLTECIRFFFDEQLEGAHDALADVRACKRVYFAIKERVASE